MPLVVSIVVSLSTKDAKQNSTENNYHNCVSLPERGGGGCNCAKVDWRHLVDGSPLTEAFHFHSIQTPMIVTSV